MDWKVPRLEPNVDSFCGSAGERLLKYARDICRDETKSTKWASTYVDIGITQAKKQTR
jgi:hypothetical protein